MSDTPDMKLAPDGGLPGTPCSASLDWKRGPNHGGEGTAGMRDGYGWWWDGDMLLCVVEHTSGSRDVFVGVVQADGDMLSLTYPDSGDDTGWMPDDLTWYAKIDGLLPPQNA